MDKMDKMDKKEKRTCVLNTLTMYINSMPAGAERTDLLNLMKALEDALPRNTFSVNMALLFSIGATTDQIREMIKTELNLDLEGLRNQNK